MFPWLANPGRPGIPGLPRPYGPRPDHIGEIHLMVLAATVILRHPQLARVRGTELGFGLSTTRGSPWVRPGTVAAGLLSTDPPQRSGITRS